MSKASENYTNRYHQLMTDSIEINYTLNTLSFADIKKHIEENFKKGIVLKKVNVSEEDLAKIESSFPNHLVHFIIWNKTLMIGPSISTNFVLEHSEEFIKCYQMFTRTANQLMQTLAKNFKINLDNPEELYKLKKSSPKQRGSLNSSWDYYFHGTECAFSNKETGQYIDIKINYGKEYGVIGNYFLFRFIETTEALLPQLKLLDFTSSNLQKVTNVLKSTGVLTPIKNGKNNELVIKNW